MQRLARAGCTSMAVRGKALELTSKGFGTPSGLAQKDETGEATRLFRFVRDQIRYVKDPDGAEFLHTPEWVLHLAAGDCDDKSILLASLLLSIGHTPRFAAVAFDADPDTGEAIYSHVWVQDWLGGRWVDLETTENLPFGKAVPLEDALDIITLDV